MDHHDLQFERRIKATPAHLYACLTDPEARQIWGAPGEGQVVIVDTPTPVEVGQRETSRCGPADNPYVTVHTDWLLLSPGEHVAYAETLSAEGAPLGITLANYAIAGHPEGSALTIHLHLTSYVGAEMKGEFEGGWAHALNNLQTLAERST
ncbi:MAG: SRPBCC family protein [Shimia sp.]